MNTADEVRRNDLQKYIKLVSEDGDDKIINSYNEFFKIESIYNEHRKYIFEFIKKIQIYNDDLLKSIYESYKDIFNGVEDVRKIALGLYESRDYLQQPLSKLTNDIYEQLKY